MANIVLSLPDLFLIQDRLGIDTKAYINQAGQVVNGQRDYDALMTDQGPCNYPAGHIWLYAPIYVMFTHLEWAEHYLKLLHFAVASICNFYMGSISYKYFKHSPQKAQLVCFMLLANQKCEYLMFND